MGKRVTKRNKIDNKRFVEAYMRSDFNYQVAEELGISQFSVATTASKLRKLGVKLPFRYEPVEVDELNRVIEAVEAELQKEITNDK